MSNSLDTFKKFKQTVEFVLKNKNSSFYREKYKDINLDTLHSWEDIQKIPFLTKKELTATDPLQRVFRPWKQINRIQITSGTTSSRNPLVMFGNSLHPLQVRVKGKHLRRLRCRVLLTLHPILSEQCRFETNEIRSLNILPLIGNINDLELTAQLAAQIQIDAISTTSSTLSYFLPYLKKEYSLNKIKYIYLGGEFCSEQKAKLFKKIFKNAYIQFGFGSNETFSLGERCPYLEKKAPRFFHPLPIFYYEVIGSSSELIVTHLFTNTGFPLVRYKTGNSVRLLDKPCPCGNNRMLEVFGKIGYEVANIGGVKIYAHLVSKALTPYLTYLSQPDFRLHLYEHIISQRVTVELKLELVLKKLYQTRLEELGRIMQNGISDKLYLSPSLTLSDLEKKGVFLPLRIEFVPAFPPSHKTQHFISHIT